ncbi:MucBP domain-containing protein [Carnobacterium maltaromaticum]|uniref:MucBP domain-containing protein n=1 Tax=Carnobacterium maltaromaticum TaxID=2751 RepID=UPI0011AE90D3|nr:MucBP domain-containing protein [Carnobacterium maltaromaticum]
MYDKIPTKAKDVKILYLDYEGMEIHTPQLISGNIGDVYDSRTNEYKLLIEGYELDQSQLPDNSTGILSEKPQTVRYVYHKIPVKAKDVRVIYLNSEGVEIHAPQFISGNIGDVYNVDTDEYKVRIEGYILDESQLPENAFGTLGKVDQTVTYVYKEIEIVSGVVNQPIEKPFDDQDNKTITFISSRDLLPKTGEVKNPSHFKFGISILIIVCLIIDRSKNKDVFN